MNLGKLETWFSQKRHALVPLGLLAIAVAITSEVSAPPSWTATAFLVPFAIALLVGFPRAESGSAWNQFTRIAPRAAATGLVTLLVHRFWNDLSWRAGVLTPIWIALLAAHIALLQIMERAQLRSAGHRVTSRFDLPAIEGALILVAGYFARSYWAASWPNFWFFIVAAVAWVFVRSWRHASQFKTSVKSEAASVAAMYVGLAAGGAAALWALHVSIGRAHLCIALWAGLALCAFRVAVWRFAQGGREAVSEPLRWIALMAAALWLMRGFSGIVLRGGGDAQWYGTMLADMIAQVRSGIFPVWQGQTELQFSGVIYPLRVAPLFHYIGALTDLLTLQTLPPFAVQNLMLTLLALAAASTSYISFRVLMLRQRWLALLFSILFLACPGVLGIAYISDLYMSWTTLPWVPLVWLAIVLSFEAKTRSRGLFLMATALGLCWWGHSPIALWSTIVAGVSQLVRVVLSQPSIKEFKVSLGAGLWFAAIALYPIGSVLLFAPEAGVKAASFQAATAGNIVNFLREVFPSVLLPLSAMGRALGDLQLGYALWALWIAVGIHCWKRGDRTTKTLWSLGAGFVVLLNPIPGLDLALWRVVPAFVRDTTSNWVMNRLYLVLSTTVLFSAAALIRAHSTVANGLTRMITSIALIGCGWSLFEARKFHHGSDVTKRTESASTALLRPENVQITRFAYLIFPKLPETFTHGATDPELEHRLLNADGRTVLANNGESALAASKIVATAEFTTSSVNPSWLEMDQPLRLSPGKRYIQAWSFKQPSPTAGTLQLIGDTLFRQYQLPEYGEPLSFGFGENHRSWLGLRTSSDHTEQAAVRFIPASPDTNGASILPFATATLREFEPSILPVRVERWAPYRAHVDSPSPGWLETPRMYQRYYRAAVNGSPAEVRKSPRGLTLVAVPAQASTVDLWFAAPFGLVAAFWLSSFTIVFSFAWGTWTLVREQELSPSAAPQ